MSVNRGARPSVLPWFNIECIDFKVTDPAASDPNAEVLMVYTNQALKMTVTIKVDGMWRPLFTGPEHSWITNFYANALGMDIVNRKELDCVRTSSARSWPKYL